MYVCTSGETHDKVAIINDDYCAIFKQDRFVRSGEKNIIFFIISCYTKSKIIFLFFVACSIMPHLYILLH